MNTSCVKIRKLFSFASVPDVVFELKHLSDTARLTLAWALGRPNDWSFSVTHIQHTLGLSRRKWRRVRDELEADGWMRQWRSHDGETVTEDGRRIQNAVRWHIVITDEPLQDLIAQAALEQRAGTARQPSKPSSQPAEEPAEPGGKAPSSRNGTMESSTDTVCIDGNRVDLPRGLDQEEDPPLTPPSAERNEPADAGTTERDSSTAAEGGENPDAPLPHGAIVQRLIAHGMHWHRVSSPAFSQWVKHWTECALTPRELEAAIAMAHEQLPGGGPPESPNYYRWAVDQVLSERDTRSEISGTSRTGKDNRSGSRKAKSTNYGERSRSHGHGHKGLDDKDYRDGASTDEELDDWLARWE